MVLCNVECIERIARYLDVSPEKLEILDKDISLATDYQKSSSLQAFSTTVQALVRASKCANILSDEREVEALSQQWLEYVTVCVNYADIPANTKRIFHELNTALRDVTFITGTRKTIADVTLYYILHPIMKGLNQQEKAKYIHVSRWFDNVQQEERLRQELDLVSFNLLHLFV